MATVMTANVFAVEKKELMPLIEKASTNRESAYVEVRDKIVGFGTNALPLLAEIAVDEALPWQQRLIARICYERVERKEDIKKLIETNWYSHPKFNPEWNKLITGPEIDMGEMVIPELREIGLWYYYLEVEWKMTGEQAEIRRGDRYRWVSWCTFTAKDSSIERIWFLRICSDLVETTPASPRVSWIHSILRREEKPDAVYLLEHRVPPPVTSEPPFRLGTNIVKRVTQP